MKTLAVLLLACGVSSSVLAARPLTTGLLPVAMATSDEKRDARNEEHIKSLHSKLQITAAEEPLWDTVAKTMRENVTQIDQVIDKREAAIGKATAVDDLNAYAEVAQAHADSVKKMATAFAPLYAAMSDPQKVLADKVFTQHGHDGKKGKRAEK